MANHNITKILPCLKDSLVTCNKAFSTFHDTLNGFSMLFNILHLLLLKKIKNPEPSNSSSIMASMSILIIFNSFTSICYYNCYITDYLLGLKDPYWAFILIQAMAGFSPLSRYIVLLIISIERYIGICLPYKYKTHFFVRNAIKLNFTIIVSALLVIPMINIAFSPEFCQSPLKIRYVYSTKATVFLSLVGVVFSLLTLITASLLVTSWKRLRKLNVVGSKKKIKTASTYIIWTGITYQLTSLPTIVSVFIEATNISLEALEAMSAIIFALYGFANVILYACFHSKYMKEVRHIVGSVKCCSSVKGKEVAMPPTNLA